MRILSAAIFLFWALYCSGAFAEQLSGSAYASSEGNRHIVSFSGWYGGEQADYEYIFFGRQSVGICTPDEFLYDSRIPFVLEPWNGPGLRLSGTIEFEAPNSGVLYRYQPYAMDYDGNERIILNWCATDFTSSTLVSCEEAPFLRGRLLLEYGYGGIGFRVEACDEDCWTEWLGLNHSTLDLLVELGGEDALSLIGEVVDVYGTKITCQLLGSDSHEVTRIEPAPLSVCGPVPVEATSWGGVKSMYR